LAVTGLAACASGARTGAMTAPVAPDQIVADNSPIKKAIAVGAVTDAMGSLSYALNVSAAMLAVGAIAAAFQRKLRRTSATVIPGRE